ncbi:retrotransposon protein, putative, ty1-copia subclass [Tanacetum coccineum]
MGKTVGELHAMLIEYAKGLPKKAETPRVMMIKDGKIQKSNKKSLKAKGKGKANGKGKDKQVYIPKPKNPKPSAKEHPAKDDTCHHCKEVGHYNCHYVPSITRGVVSVHRLVENGFVQCFTDFGISVSKNNVHYFNVIPSNGIYEIDMNDLVPNNNSIYNVSTERVKRNLDSTYLWHCRHAHISKKRIEKLQQEGLLRSTDDESFDQCVSCLSGKMTRKSFPHRPERATDLLGIIHTDVCGPLRHVSRQGASYFITFTDDYSRYGYVYLLKHKHEVFETFKVFKNEVENQLGKTIKALRSDRGGEYISQEFKDYLKACGIVQQLTPPYTPQHNGVSERRNRTLLDMVRSMMNLTTLPLSFWDYALESATRILNMVPTKKVDKTPYELWYGKVPNLSYLKVWGCEALVKRDTPDKLQQRSVKCIFIGYPKETMGYYFYFPPENKIVVARYAEFFEKNLITQEVSGRAIDLEEIQDEDTSPSEITSEIPMEVEGFEPPQEEVIPIRRSERTHQRV